jgi:hypothetical protein
MIGSLSQMLEALPHTTAEERIAMRARAVRQLGGCNQAAGRAASQLIKAIDALDHEGKG